MKIVAIIPAHNEEDRIGQVLVPLLSSRLFSRVIVVDDGSADRTGEVAQKMGAEVWSLGKNSGKGAALQKGLEVAGEADIYFFLDADLLGLKEEHLEKMLNPLLEEEDLVMTVGIFKGGRFKTDLAQVLAPQISGQRAFKKVFLENLPDLTSSGFGCEIIIEQHLENQGFKHRKVYLQGLSQVVKEEKIGYLKGFLYRLKMYRELFANWLKTRFLLA